MKKETKEILFFFHAKRNKFLLKIQLVWMSRLEVVQNDVEIVRWQNTLAGWI